MGSLKKTTRWIIGLFTSTPPATPKVPDLKNPTPLQGYLDKYVTQFIGHLVPPTRPSLPSDVDPNAYKRVAFSVQPLLHNSISPYYGGKFDDDTDFSASLIKVAALFAAGQLLAKAKVSGATFGADVQAEVNSKADTRITHTTFPTTSAVQLMPQMADILNPSGGGPAVQFATTFSDNLDLMIVQSDDPAAAFCIDKLGYGYISAELNQKNFFKSTEKTGPDASTNTGRGIWLAGDYEGGLKVRIPCINDHPDAQLTTTRQMCRMFAMIRLKQLPENDVATNTIMQGLLGRAPTWLRTGQHIAGVKDVGVPPQFSKVHAKVGVAGLGTAETPLVYSEGLIIKWGDQSQVDKFNNTIDPTNEHPNDRLPGEFAVCWQNLLARILPSGFDGIVEVLNNTIADFLEQKTI